MARRNGCIAVEPNGTQHWHDNAPEALEHAQEIANTLNACVNVHIVAGTYQQLFSVVGPRHAHIETHTVEGITIEIKHYPDTTRNMLVLDGVRMLFDIAINRQCEATLCNSGKYTLEQLRILKSALNVQQVTRASRDAIITRLV